MPGPRMGMRELRKRKVQWGQAYQFISLVERASLCLAPAWGCGSYEKEKYNGAKHINLSLS